MFADALNAPSVCSLPSSTLSACSVALISTVAPAPIVIVAPLHEPIPYLKPEMRMLPPVAENALPSAPMLMPVPLFSFSKVTVPPLTVKVHAMPPGAW